MLHNCPRCGAVCECEGSTAVEACFHECESWTGHEQADPFADALEKGDVVPLDEVRRDLEDKIAAHEADVLAQLSSALRLPPDVLRSDLDKVEFHDAPDPFAEFEAGQDRRHADRMRWRRGEFTDAERATLALFSAEHLDGQPWGEVLDHTAIEDLLEIDGTAPESDGITPNSDGTSADCDGWERDL